MEEPKVIPNKIQVEVTASTEEFMAAIEAHIAECEHCQEEIRKGTKIIKCAHIYQEEGKQ
jgi:hypothetical protein